MIAIFNSLPVKTGAEDQVVGRFAESRGNVRGFPGFVSMEVLKDEGEVLVVTRWETREAFDAWVASDDFKAAHSGPSAAEFMTGRPKMTTYEVAVERIGADGS
ncbi:antibiotic biosynthesis monooxygenase family protein [Rubrobacter indicoceani]|uniref:antibiotic biosynthesis monooxygenase family protein n=1 Tax=Rubrobacter indicoceani TaxID=2051957 RepID=UPI000E5B8768|nr:antibiotic biosynthesis monooxygenase [Rubrobacter indicoceani]